ncbi:MAG: hypothetical protein JXX14_07575, partial [Deltaproteobacteria bacterium]|nr:hypothetical protein [Deltaproteobacteria bacterium]
WRLGVFGAGMGFDTPHGKAISGAASAYLGLTPWGFATSRGHIGELNIGVMLGAVHARGMAAAPNEDERHTRPLAAAETDFTFLINPQPGATLGFRIFAGWMLGMWLRANDNIIGGLNSFYGGAGLVFLLQPRKTGQNR